MEGVEGSSQDRRKRLRIHLLGFVIVSVAVIILLTLLGAEPLLIVEVFALALILGVGAVMVLVIFSGRQRSSWK